MNPRLDAMLFDGLSARGRPVVLHVDGDELLADGDPPARWPLARVRWPERTRHGRRVLHLESGESIQVTDAAAFDAWAHAAGRADSWVVRAQQHWPATLAALLALVGTLVAAYLWGVPAAARALVALVPAAVDARVGDGLAASLDEQWLKPSRLAAARQQAVREAFARAVAAAGPPGRAVAYRVEFRAAPDWLGPNALALPGGTIVVTDALVDLLAGRDEVVVGVLAHELGHLRHRHGMRSLVQVTLVATAVGLVLGDFSTVLAGAPTLLAQMSYSRDFERQADAESVRVLRAAGISPAVMAEFFERVQPRSDGAALPIALASHPGSDERVRYFREAASGR